MKLIRTTRLVRRQKLLIVHCEIDLCHLPGTQDGYLVNVRQGRSGDEWRDSTRTPNPVDLNTAEAIFAQLLYERQAQGFIDLDAAAAPIGVAPILTDTLIDADRRAADAQLLRRLEPAIWKSLSEPQRARTIWRIGERRLRDVVPAFVGLLGSGRPIQDYCLAWAIGRCGDAGAAQAMRELHTRAEFDSVRRIALQAWLELVDKAQLEQHVASVIADWPARLREAWVEENEDAFIELCATPGRWQKLTLSDWLEQLDQVARVQPKARAILLAQLRSLPLRAGTFRAIRHLYKAAEMRVDADLFGLIHYRIETTRSDAIRSTDVYVQARRRYVSFAEEAARPDSTVAYSVRTRDYLLRRSWRTLRRLGQDHHPDYVSMATGALLAMDDASAGQPHQRGGRSYDRYSHWMLFNRLLRSQGVWIANRSGHSWHQLGLVRPASGRDEAFPELWDQRPDALLTLMQRSRCEGVHEFAARALLANTQFCTQLSLDELRTLLRSPYAATARLAFQLCRQRFEPGVPDTNWLLLLLQSTLPEAQQYAIDCIGREPDRFSADPVLVAALACSPDEAPRRLGRMLCQCALALPGQPEAIVLLLLDWLDNCADLDNAPAVVPAIGADLLWLVEHPLRAAAAEAPYARLVNLLGHRLASVRILAGEWLLRHNVAPAAIPGDVLASLLKEQDAAVRGVAIKLFSALPDHVLAEQAMLFGAFCTHPDAGVRRAIDAAMVRVAPAHPVFRATLMPLLLDTLFRSETAEGLHADLIAWITGPLNSGADYLDRALVLRLLSARSKGAQQLGALLLPRFEATQFDVADWAQFGRNENASVRAWAFAAYEEHTTLVRSSMEAALRLLDSRWEDSRQFATRYFEQRCHAGDWTPNLLVNLCDHLDPAVQRFGRHMLTTHFEVADVTEYMLKLSQHPSANMQLFVSTWLESASSGDLQKLQRLEPYFLSVLSQVNRGRVVKNRILEFLRAQAISDEPIAGFVARIFARQVLTVAIADKAQYIEGLRAIQTRFPELPAIMSIEPPRALSPLPGAA